jgi:hypothetical protein
MYQGLRTCEDGKQVYPYILGLSFAVQGMHFNWFELYVAESASCWIILRAFGGWFNLFFRKFIAPPKTATLA